MKNISNAQWEKMISTMQWIYLGIFVLFVFLVTFIIIVAMQQGIIMRKIKKIEKYGFVLEEPSILLGSHIKPKYVNKGQSGYIIGRNGAGRGLKQEFIPDPFSQEENK